ncbi:hypothetical protein [Pyrolobus fumarii]|nr:hypothetical protein [Pyrolobus fumarii]
MTRLWYSLRASLWLHMVRTKRLAPNMLDYSINMSLWALINVFILYAIYGPAEGRLLASSVIPWLYYTIALATTAGWLTHYTVLGLTPYELAAGHNPLLTIAGRIVTSVLPATLASLIVMAIVRPIMSPYVVLATALALLLGHAYGLLLAALGASMGVRGTILDILGYASGLFGGMIIPLRDYPHMFQALAFLIPPAPIGEIARMAPHAYQSLTVMPFEVALSSALAWIAILYMLAALASRRTLAKIRREGLRSARL